MSASTSAACKETLIGELPGRARVRPPVELRIALIFTAFFVFCLLVGLPISLPNEASYRFAQYHYFAPLVMAFALQLPIAYLSFRKNRADPFLLLKLLPFMGLVILLHFNFKAWMPLVNSNSYDEFYQRIDEVLWPLVQGFCWLRALIADALPLDLNRAYHSLFVGMFFIAFSAHALVDTPQQQRRLVLGLCLILLLGGICYWAAPAVGPFLYREGLNPESTGAQAHMLSMFKHLTETGEIPPGYFTAPLAAMPSLHVAHALFFTLFAARSIRPLFWFFLPILFWIVIESVASGWHYLVDLPVGAALALLALALVRVFVPDPIVRDS